MYMISPPFLKIANAEVASWFVTDSNVGNIFYPSEFIIYSSGMLQQ